MGHCDIVQILLKSNADTNIGDSVSVYCISKRLLQVTRFMYIMLLTWLLELLC